MGNLGDILYRLVIAVSFLGGVFIAFVGVIAMFEGHFGLGLFVVLISPLIYFVFTRGLRWILTGEKVETAEMASFFSLSLISKSWRTFISGSIRVFSVFKNFFLSLDVIIPKTLKGDYSLGRTYWYGAVLSGLILSLPIVLPLYFYSSKIAVLNPTIHSFWVAAVLLLLLVIQVFFIISVNNAATNNRKRGFWGWLAITLLTLGLLQIILQLSLALGFRDPTWSEFQEGIRIENLSLPAEIDEVTVLKKMETNSSDKSLTYKFDVDLDGLEKRDFNQVLEGKCARLESIFAAGVGTVFYDYSGRDGSKKKLTIPVDDCK